MNEPRLARITLEPGKCSGSPCIRGYRLRVSDILALLGAGASHAEILEDTRFWTKKTSSRPWSMRRSS